MGKYVAHISFYIKANNRGEAVDVAVDIINSKLRRLASLDKIDRLQPADHPEWVIAVNEPINAQS